MAVLLGLPLLALVERSFACPAATASPGTAPSRSTGTSGLFVPPTEAIRNSLVFAAIATVIATAVGGLASIAIGGRHTRAWLDIGLMLPLGMSAVTVGFGFLITLDEPPLDLRAKAILVPIAQALVALPFVVRAVVPVLRSIDDRLREAAAVLGASPSRTWREVDLPLVSRALAVGAGFAFAVSLGEFGATVFVARPDTPTLPIAIFRLLGRPGASNFGQAMAMATILMALTVRVRADLRARCASAISESSEVLDCRRSHRALRRARGARRRRPVGARRGDRRRARPERLRQVDAAARDRRARAAGGGTIAWDGTDLAGTPPHKRRFGLMFQDYALFPHRDVAGNVAFGLRMQGRAAADVERRVAEVLALVGLDGFEHRSVTTLSGGEQQRVALARALAPEPRLLMLDEPLGALDRTLRERLTVDLEQLLHRLGMTSIYVTHDHAEARAIGDQLVVMRAGRDRADRDTRRRRRPSRERVRRRVRRRRASPRRRRRRSTRLACRPR